jgi:hypothetical protein
MRKWRQNNKKRTQKRNREVIGKEELRNKEKEK